MTGSRTIQACMRAGLVFLLGACAGAAAGESIESSSPPSATWEMARARRATLGFSTLFTAQDVRRYLSSPEGITRAIEWCRDTAVTHVFIETFRGGYTAETEHLQEAKRRFADAGFGVSGCVTTTGIGRESVEGWIFPCFTEQAGLDKLKSVFEHAAGVFDEIMIDDFLATRCLCPDCKQVRGERPWCEFRCDMMVDVSRRYILEPARRVTPNVKLIIKYPQWYDEFHDKGYDVVRQTEMFDRIWVGTETRDPDSSKWGRKAQYEAYFIMRWLGGIGGEKCGGGWFDPYGTSPPTYLEQARQTVLGGAKEALLFCYGSLQSESGRANVAVLRKELPQLFALAEMIRGKAIRGIAAVKPPNSDADGNAYIYDHVGMMGLPLVPAAEVRTDVAAAFLPVQAFKDPNLARKLSAMVKKGTPLLLTRQLADRVGDAVPIDRANVQVLDAPKDPWELMDLPADRLGVIRKTLLGPFGIEFDAPTRVALYLFDDDLIVLESFNDQPVSGTVSMNSTTRPTIVLAIPEGAASVAAERDSIKWTLGPRSLVAIRIRR